jgi:hypothetical protein
MRALSRLEGEYASGGMSPADLEAMRLAGDQVSARAGSDYQAIQGMLARRGGVGSGMEAALYGQAGQSAAGGLAHLTAQSQIAARQRALQALEASGALAGQVRGQDWGIASQRATAQDAINRFNASQRAASQAYNLGLPQQEFENRLRYSNARNGLLTGQMAEARDAGQRYAGYASAFGNAALDLGKAYGGE